MGPWPMVGAGLLGAVVVLGILLLTTLRRVRMLEALDFVITGPVVPRNVLDATKAAERAAYWEMSVLRRFVEDCQDAAGLLWPQMVYRLNFSMGAYRIKSGTVHALIDYAIDNGYLVIHSDRGRHLNRALPYLAIQPWLNDWQAALVLQSLKDQHPLLRQRTWHDIAHDPNAIAALYSGYTGAGGAWQLWESAVSPGPVARHRVTIA